MSQIFVSHAHWDLPLVEALVNQVLRGGLGIPSGDIFCSSMPGHTIPPGQDFKAYMKDIFQRSHVVLSLISRNYYASAYCMCELGASWVSDHKVFLPILVPPVSHRELKAVLSGMQVLELNCGTDLDQLKDACERVLSRNTNTAQWNQARQQFLSQIATILEKIECQESISQKEYVKIVKEKELLLEEVVALRRIQSKETAYHDTVAILLGLTIDIEQNHLIPHDVRGKKMSAMDLLVRFQDELVMGVSNDDSDYRSFLIYSKIAPKLLIHGLVDKTPLPYFRAGVPTLNKITLNSNGLAFLRFYQKEAALSHTRVSR